MGKTTLEMDISKKKEEKIHISSRDGETVSIRKRKRPLNGEERGVSEEATDEELEVKEFFAIMRRMHVAAKRMPKAKPSSNDTNNNNKRNTTAGTAFEWRPAFRLEDFGVGGGEVEIPRESDFGEIDFKRSRGGLCLDLNAVPEE